MTEHVHFTTPNRHQAKGAIALPPGDLRGPGLVVVHEWWGLNDDIRRLTTRFAAEGFVTLAVDLYGHEATTDPAEALRRANELSTVHALDVIAGAARYLATHARSIGKIGVTGFCLGGAMALAAACGVDEVRAAVPFYGTPKDQYLDFAPTKAPIQGHYGKLDGFVSPDRAKELAERAGRAGARFELHLYDAGHAFLREHDPAAYEPVSAKLAWDRAIAFLHRELASELA